MFMRMYAFTRPLRWLAACLLPAIAITSAAAATITLPAATTIICYVSATGLSNPASATSWATSTSNLQGAIDHVQGAGGGEVWVANGLYKPGSSTATSFSMANNVTIYGGFAIGQTNSGDRNLTGPSGTTLSGDLGGDAHSWHIINNPESLSLNASAILDGFVITGGDARPNYERGGGIRNNHADPTFRNCVFINNIAEFGGAIVNFSSSPTLINCSFVNNEAINEGGAIDNENDSSPSLLSCSFLTNSARASGGAIITYGGFPVITNCSFINNSTGNEGSGGGALYNQESSPSIMGCSFINNTTPIIGGAIVNNGGSSPAITNCAFIGNSAGDQGGAMINMNESSPGLLNCSLLGNSALNEGGAICNFGSSVVIANSILFGNGTSNAFKNVNTNGMNGPIVSSISANYSLFEASSVSDGQVTQTNCLTTTTSPFVSTTSVMPAAGSPAIDAGNPLSQTVANGPYSETNLPATDLAGNPRIQSGRVDMGALEYSIPDTPAPGLMSLIADESGCPVKLVAQGTATTFVFTGSNGYVFSSVYRQRASRQVIATEVKVPGIYTLQGINTTSSGSSDPVTLTVTVSKSCQ